MGSCAGDVNNDGLVDFLAADMSFRTHFKDKVFMGDMSSKFRNVGFFPHDQLMRNALFVNTGTSHFQEAAYLAGLASTNWTWDGQTRRPGQRWSIGRLLHQWLAREP